MEQRDGRATGRVGTGRTRRVLLVALVTVGVLAGGVTAAGAAPGEDHLLPGEVLEPGQALVSADGSQTLVVQPDGDLGLYGADGAARWTAGTTVPGVRLAVADDGDVRLVGPDGEPVWSTGTVGAAGAALVVQDDGDVVVRAPDGVVVWQSGTAVRPSLLGPGGELRPGEALSSPDGRHTLLVLDDGDVVLLGPDAATRWSTGTHEPGSTLRLGDDGNLVLGAPDGSWEWRSRTAGNPGATLVVQDDGDVVLYAVDGTPLWSSGTALGPAELAPGAALSAGQELASLDGHLRLRLDETALTLTYDGRAVWAAPVPAAPGAGARLAVQDDGNLVLAAADGTPLWATGTASAPGSRLRTEGGSVLLVAATGQELWRVDVPPELLVRRAELALDCTAVDAPIPLEDTVVTETGVRVHPCLAAGVDELLLAARADGIDLHAWGWRSAEQQIALRARNCHASGSDPSVVTCHPPTAVPGTSRHERGLALDLTVDGRVVQRGSAAFAWLVEHAPAYGLENLPSEAWHWSVDGW
ncbi:D-alanyl-D-alanine carboxypeptidase family protein [Cellulomonas fimi]|uniref:Curculin domain protein (Mannose-binding) lectin n=1 Tax=Cellulomonas fimi (strain ATCC 484 / DSM 20113 / JCM 1341 / CCUG 24087 / LMG 16345 / NBRC 15513 / NCIMB 8980 / NCTC 7547 / NRS-133) TaxID=590998 RepID=F4H3F9_CELFA|nr:D-alanyl-D-alanine carboxypeptidase family protein [Cellulomonas fimi]AEE46504.1 Curculin domain protein (mannose-binding) lectin [Cellulomonas fimi ATCC 484]VEH33256.1 D-alanyl-D-alanine carboxypeptidase [Cellulomonas fimi]